ncbi:hypothetical protein [Christensenella minuta]|uniref:hypothetical protein n=1 Tax=Christensenella minuta TaxID=626937 RepID=UPI0038B23EB4
MLDKAIWRESTAEQKVILVTLLMMANHAENEWEWGGEKFKAKPGQFVTSEASIVEKCGNGVKRQSVRTALKKFEKYEFLTREATKRNSLITIINWEKYQGSKRKTNQRANQELTKSQPTANQELTTNKNEKNDKNIKRGGALTPSPSSWKRDSVQRSMRPSESGGGTRVKEKRHTKKRAGKNFCLNSRIKLMSMGNRLWLKHWTGRSLQGGRDGIFKVALQNWHRKIQGNTTRSFRQWKNWN